jgi:hypothetical protein
MKLNCSSVDIGSHDGLPLSESYSNLLGSGGVHRIKHDASGARANGLFSLGVLWAMDLERKLVLAEGGMRCAVSRVSRRLSLVDRAAAC